MHTKAPCQRLLVLVSYDSSRNIVLSHPSVHMELDRLFEKRVWIGPVLTERSIACLALLDTLHDPRVALCTGALDQSARAWDANRLELAEDRAESCGGGRSG